MEVIDKLKDSAKKFQTGRRRLFCHFGKGRNDSSVSKEWEVNKPGVLAVGQEPYVCYPIYFSHWPPKLGNMTIAI